MADSTPLPRGWVRDYEGTVGATYRRDPTGIEVVIEPRYTVDRNHRRVPTSYRVRVKRPFWHGRGDPVQLPLVTVDTFDAAKVQAREYMEMYNERYRRTHDRGDAVRRSDGQRADRLTATSVATETVAELGVDSAGAAVEQLRALLGDGLLAVWDVAGDTVEVHHTTEAFDRDRVFAVSDATAALDASPLAAELGGDVACVTAAVGDCVLYRFPLADALETVIAVDEASQRAEPNFTRAAAAVFAARE